MTNVLPSDWCARIAGCALLVMLLGGGLARGQQIIINQVGRIDVLGTTGAGADGFTVRKVPNDVADAMEEFARYSEKGEWEKAFSTLPTVADSPASSLVAAGNGFYLPIRTRYRQLLVGLSPAGREAYRVFNDAPARQALAQLTEENDPASPAVANELLRLQELFDKYFITSVGDQIGDRLGDAKFESGDFSGAAEVWGAIVQDFPDTTLSPMRLAAKRAIALARAKRWDDFSSAATFLREKYPTEKIRLGGRDIPVRTLLDDLSAASPREGGIRVEPGRVEQASAVPIQFPISDDPLWQCVFADDVYLAEVDRLFRAAGLAGAGLSPVMVSPRVWSDDQQIYLNWFGILMVIDAQTGKLLFRSNNFTALPGSLQQVMQLGFDASSDQAILPMPGANRVLVMSPSLSSPTIVRTAAGTAVRAGSGQIACYDTTGFKELWKSTGSGLATWSLLGTPWLDGTTLYATGRSLTTTSGAANTSMEMSVLAIDGTNGRLLWTLPLGNMSAMTNVRGLSAMPKPVMQKVRDTLYIQTGDSAVVAVNVEAKRVEWAYTWGTPAPAPPADAAARNPVSYVYRQVDPLQCPSSIAVSEAGLFVKDRNSSTLHALDVNGASLKWTRPVESSSFIVGADGESVYLLGRQLDCIDIRTKELRWSSKTPGVNGAVEPLAIGSHLYVFGARGVYDLDLGNGDPKIFYGYDRESYGGTIRRVGNRLICVSSRSVTAYGLPEN